VVVVSNIRMRMVPNVVLVLCICFPMESDMRIRTQPLVDCMYLVHAVGSLYECTHSTKLLGRIGFLCTIAASVSNAGSRARVELGHHAIQGVSVAAM
jgi:hypothetical protein